MMPAQQSDPLCEICGGTNVVKHLPQEIDRRLDREEIMVPDESEPKKMTVAILRITYEGEYFCAGCGHWGAETFVTEKQNRV